LNGTSHQGLAAPEPPRATAFPLSPREA
jgi:hypothetical protein